MGDVRRHFQQPLIPLPIETNDGQFTAFYSSIGLAALHFPGSHNRERPQNAPAALWQWDNLTTSAVKAVLNGLPPADLPPLDLSGGTSFQQSVWSEMRKLPPGQTLSYRELAARLGIPGGARAVGNACGANPIPLLIPCHRVLAAGGKLGGFSGGLEWKRKLLAREGIAVAEALAGRGTAEPMLLAI